MAKEDWDATLPAQKPERPLAQRDVDITHGQTLTLGDETLTFTILYGHTPGTLGIFIPVKWHGQSHVVLLHGGGLQHPNRESLNRFESVIKDYALKMNAEGILNAHPGIYQDTLADMETIRKNPGGSESAALRQRARHALLEDHGRMRRRRASSRWKQARNEMRWLMHPELGFVSQVACARLPRACRAGERRAGAAGRHRGLLPDAARRAGQTTVVHVG